MQFRVPIDDTHTYHVSLYVFPAAPGTNAPEQPSVPGAQQPSSGIQFGFPTNQRSWRLGQTRQERHPCRRACPERSEGK